jgi:hypothetical protein
MSPRARGRSWRSSSTASSPSSSASAFHFSVFVLLMKSASVRPRSRNVLARRDAEGLGPRSSGKDGLAPELARRHHLDRGLAVAAAEVADRVRAASCDKSSMRPVKNHSSASAIVLLRCRCRRTPPGSARGRNRLQRVGNAAERAHRQALQPLAHEECSSISRRIACAGPRLRFDELDQAPREVLREVLDLREDLFQELQLIGALLHRVPGAGNCTRGAVPGFPGGKRRDMRAPAGPRRRRGRSRGRGAAPGSSRLSADPARHDQLERREVQVHVEREAVRRHPARQPDADRADLLVADPAAVQPLIRAAATPKSAHVRIITSSRSRT